MRNDPSRNAIRPLFGSVQLPLSGATGSSSSSLSLAEIGLLSVLAGTVVSNGEPLDVGRHEQQGAKLMVGAAENGGAGR